MRKIKKITDKWIDEIYEIEKEAFEDFWSKEMLSSEFDVEQSDIFGIFDDDFLAGFVIVWHYLDEAHIMDIAVRKSERKKGIATELLKYLFNYLKNEGVKFVYLEVRVSNLPAVSLYKKMGFSELGIRKNYYTNNNEDALVMKLALANS